MVQFSKAFLDSYVAPELSALAEIDEIPEIKGDANQMLFALNQALGPGRYSQRERRQIGLLIRRATSATEQFNSGRILITEYVAALPSQHHPTKYLRAVSHFEIAALHGFAALDAIVKMARGLGVSDPVYEDPSNIFSKLGKLANRARHAQEDAYADDEGRVASIWLSVHGIKWAKPGKKPHILGYTAFAEGIQLAMDNTTSLITATSRSSG